MYIKKTNTGQIYFIDEKGINFINSENYKELIFSGGDLFYDTLITNDVKISTTNLQINGKSINIQEDRLFVYNNLFNALNGNSNYYSVDLNVVNSFLGVVYTELTNTNYKIKLALTNIGKDVNDGTNPTILNKLLNKDWLVSPNFSGNAILIGFILIKYTGATFNIANPANFNFKTFPIFPLIKNKLLEDISELTFTEDNFNYIVNNIINSEYYLDNIINYNLFLNEYFLFEGSKFFIENGSNLEIYKSNVTSNLLVSEFTNTVYYKKIGSSSYSSVPSHTHLLNDITDLNTLTLDWSKIINTPSTFPSDWNTTINKPSTFPPSPHTHLLANITDFPTGTNGDILIHDDTNWQASDVVIIRNIAWFQANANNVLRKNTIVYLQEDTNCYKVGDGLTTLKNLKWQINRNYGDYSVSGYNGIFSKNTLTNKDITYSVFGQSYSNTATITNTNEFRGSFGFLPEPMIIEQLGIHIVSLNSGGGSVQIELAIYQPNFTTKQNTLIVKTDLNPIVVGVNFFPLQTAITLPSGIYFFAVRYVIPSGRSFQFLYINHYNQIGYATYSNYANASYLVLNSQLSMPTTCGFPTPSVGTTYYFFILGQRILPTI